MDRLAQARPSLPDPLGDRAADGWEPLLAIADAAGGTWPQRARDAALALSEELSEDMDEASLHVLMLADCRAAFDRVGGDRMLTASLIEELLSDEERPWREYGRSDRPVTPHGISRLLRPYGIRPGLMRIGETVGRGYGRGDFKGAWARYLPPSTELYNRYSVTNGAPEHASDTLTDTLCNGVTVVKPPTGGQGDEPEDIDLPDAAEPGTSGTGAAPARQFADAGSQHSSIASDREDVDLVAEARRVFAGDLIEPGAIA